MRAVGWMLLVACGGSHGGKQSDAVIGGDSSNPIPSPIAPDRTTAWNPGILADGQLGLPLGTDGLPVRTTVCATVNPGGNIQAAIDACPDGQVVQLAAGTFTIATTVTLTHGVVLRGAGSQG